MKLFVWDFHGVLEKGNDHAVLELSNMALEEGGYAERLTVEAGQLLAGRVWYEYFAYLLPDISLHQAHNLQKRAIELTQAYPEIITKHIKLNDHAWDILSEIEKRAYRQIVISNCLPHILDICLQQVGIEKFFPSKNRFGVAFSYGPPLAKADCLHRYLQTNKFPQKVVVIGDSPTDMVMIENHPHSVGYLYSYPGRPHRPAKCHYKTFDLRDLLREIEV